MSSEPYAQFTTEAKRCIKGESFFESIMCEFAIPHHIVGQKDIGIDYICEWVSDKKPSGVLFAVQIKTFSESTKRPVKPAFVEKCNENHLDKYNISNSNFKIKLKTLHYWKGLGMPVYLFAVFENKTGNLQCYYKRYTWILTQDKILSSNLDYSDDFYKVSKNQQLIAFADIKQKTKGFARDLFIDHMRWNYFKGSIAYLNPRSLGLLEFDEKALFHELFEEYKEKIAIAYNMMQEYLADKPPNYLPSMKTEFCTLATASPPVNEIRRVIKSDGKEDE